MAWRTSVRADEDIASIEAHGAMNFGRAQAARYVDELFAAFDLISTFPRMARERSALRASVRMHVFGSHHIFYAIDGTDMLIVRVLGGQQDWEHLL